MDKNMSLKSWLESFIKYRHYTCEVSSIEDENPFSLSPETVEKESAIVTLTFDLTTPKSIEIICWP